MAPRDFVPVTIIDVTPSFFGYEGGAVIKVYPWKKIEEWGWNPWAPVLVVQTCCGELEFTYSVDRKRFSVCGRALRFSGMPAGTTLYVHRDEARYTGPDIDAQNDLDRTPKWSVSGSDTRSDQREATRTMIRNCQTHLEFVTENCNKTRMFHALIDATIQWERRVRLCEIQTQLAALRVEQDELISQITADNLPLSC